jgi:tetratricopeptide (TPR) repeat protein
VSYAAGTPSSSSTFRKANDLLAAARYQEAVSLYQSLLASPRNTIPPADIYTKIGDSYFHLNAYQNALDAYRNALRNQAPAAQPMTRYWIGFCCFLLGHDEQAVTEFLKIPELHPEAGIWVGTAYYWAGRACQRLGWKERAAKYYKKAGGNGKSTQGRFAMKKAADVNQGASSKGQVARDK